MSDFDYRYLSEDDYHGLKAAGFTEEQIEIIEVLLEDAQDRTVEFVKDIEIDAVFIKLLRLLKIHRHLEDGRVVVGIGEVAE
jgi:hypothetical protein